MQWILCEWKYTEKIPTQILNVNGDSFKTHERIREKQIYDQSPVGFYDFFVLWCRQHA
jgi:hypothetical protein